MTRGSAGAFSQADELLVLRRFDGQRRAEEVVWQVVDGSVSACKQKGFSVERAGMVELANDGVGLDLCALLRSTPEAVTGYMIHDAEWDIRAREAG
jgi:hypothetical protein